MGEERTTLYRIDEPQYDPWAFRVLKWLKKDGVLVPVESCEHGNIDSHLLPAGFVCTIQSCTDTKHWCRGSAYDE